MALSLFSGLRRVAELFYVRLFGEQVNVEHLDPAQLKQAYREIANLRPLVDKVASFILAGGVEIESEDEDAADVLTADYKANDGTLRQAVRESCLYGFTHLLPFWDPGEGRKANGEGRCRLRVYSPSAVQFVTEETAEPGDQGPFPRAVITSTIRLRTTIQTITETTWTIESSGRPTQSGVNPLGMIPLVTVHLGRFSDDLFGSSIITDALYQTLREKQVLRAKGLSIERRQSSLLAVSGGRADIIKPKLEAMDSDKPTIPAIYLPDPKATVGFVESRRGPEGVIELLKMLYHDVIVDGQVPEFLLGVGMPSAQASTREQRAVLEGLISPLRSDWSEGLQQLNRVLLRLHEVHEIRSYVTDVTSVTFGPLFEKDAVAEADTLQKKSAALVQLNTLGIVSRETAQEAIPEIVGDVDREEERLASDRASADPYPNPVSPSPSKGEGRGEGEPPAEEPAQ